MNQILNKEELKKIDYKTDISIQRNTRECEYLLRQLIRLGVSKLVDALISQRMTESEFFRQLQNYMYCLESLEDERNIEKIQEGI